MIPGTRTSDGRLVVVSGIPSESDPRLGGFALKPSGEIYTSIAGFSPDELFANGEQGAWYDPSDFSTMFQDAAGTTPVTAVEQPVGLILDKSKGLVLGSALNSNSSFDSGMTSWSGMTNGTVDTSVSGQVTVSQTSAGATTFSVQDVTTVVGKTYKCTYVAQGVSGAVQLYVGVWDGGAKTDLPTVGSGSPQTVSLIFTASTTNVELRFGLSAYNTAGAVVTYYSATIQEIPGNHASQSTTTKRPILRQDTGGKYYLDFDGVDDSLSTAAIDFTATDKMSVFGGVRNTRNQPAAFFETSVNWNNNAGAIAQFIPINTDGRIDSGFYTGTGQNYRSSAATLSVPATYVTTLICDTTATTVATEIPIFNINKVQQSSIAGPGNGSGNFGNYPLYIGARAGTSIYFNGNIYSLIVRGALSTAQEISDTEAWVNSKTGAY